MLSVDMTIASVAINESAFHFMMNNINLYNSDSKMRQYVRDAVSNEPEYEDELSAIENKMMTLAEQYKN
jgi:hypothetical protein